MTVKPVVAALLHVWRTLEKLDAPMAVMGGLAMAAWKHVRLTHDVDILVGIGDIDVSRLIETLQKADVRPKHSPPSRRIGDLEILQLLYEPPDTFLDVQVDLLLANSVYHAAALSRRVPMTLADSGSEVSVLSADDLIIHKLAAGRAIDRADVVAVLIANRESIDITYLRQWCRSLDLVTELTDTWAEAFAGQPLPAE